MPDKPEQGRIIKGNFIDQFGHKVPDHFAMILTDNEEIEAVDPIDVVVISSCTTLSRADERVAIPWDPRCHRRTKLWLESYAICTWLRQIKKEDIIEYRGFVPDDIVEVIINKVNELLE